MSSVLTTSSRKYILDQYENINTQPSYIIVLKLQHVGYLAVELQEVKWFSNDFKATLMSWQQTNNHKHFAVLAWCVSPKSKAPHNLNISTAKYFYRNEQIKKLYCYYNTERVTCRCIKRSYDKWSNSYSIATVAQQPTFHNCWSFFHSVAL